MSVGLGRLRELLRLAFLVGRRQPQARRALVALQIGGRDSVDDPLAVRADLRPADAGDAEQIVNLDGPLVLGGGGGGNEQQQEEGGGTFHDDSSQNGVSRVASTRDGESGKL